MLRHGFIESWVLRRVLRKSARERPGAPYERPGALSAPWSAGVFFDGRQVRPHPGQAARHREAASLVRAASPTPWSAAIAIRPRRSAAGVGLGWMPRKLSQGGRVRSVSKAQFEASLVKQAAFGPPKRCSGW